MMSSCTPDWGSCTCIDRGNCPPGGSGDVSGEDGGIILLRVSGEDEGIVLPGNGVSL